MTSDDFNIIRKFGENECIELPIQNSNFRKLIFSVVKNILEFQTDKIYDDSTFYTHFNNRNTIYIKWTFNDTSCPFIWISDNSESYNIKTIEYFLELKKDSTSRGFFHSRKFGL